MSNLDVVREVFDAARPLTAVWVSRFEGDPGFVTEAKLVFGDVTLVVTAEADLDTVAMRRGDFVPDPAAVVRDVSSSELWRPALGLLLVWGWELTNQQGYSDGARFEFGGPDTDVTRVVEFIAEASALRAFLCQRAAGADA